MVQITSFQTRLIISTYQNDLFNVLGWTPMKHPCRVIFFHIGIHIVNLLIARN